MSAVLLATDLSPYADRALDRAALMAALEPGGLVVLHVVGADLMSARNHAAAVAAAADALGSYVAEAELPPDLAVSTLARGGEAGPEIVTAAQATGSRLVVLAAPHTDLLVQIFRGSTMNHVVRHAPCPVLVVRGRARRTYRRIVVAVDLSLPSRQALEVALRLLPGAAMAEVEMTVVHAGSAVASSALVAEATARLGALVSASLSRLATEGRTPPGRIETLTEPGRPAVVLPAMARRLRAELVVVGTMGLTGAANLLLGSTAEAMLASLPCDVLAVRPE